MRSAIPKPHKEFFDLTFRQIDNPPKDRVLVIGDSLNSDIRGGNDYGLATCWYNPGKKENATGILPSLTVGSFDELRSFLI